MTVPAVGRRSATSRPPEKVPLPSAPAAETEEVRRWAPSRLRLWSPESPVPIYVGVATSVLGFALVAVTWGQVAGETSVSLQLPYLLSGGFTGIALVITGLMAIAIAARRREAVRRERQLDRLADLLRQIRETVQ